MKPHHGIDDEEFDLVDELEQDSELEAEDFEDELEELESETEESEVAPAEDLSVGSKPTIETVIDYGIRNLPSVARSKLRYSLEDRNAFRFHLEEIRSELHFRLLKSYDDLDPKMGWKSFTYHHVVGAVQDYKKKHFGTRRNPDPSEKILEAIAKFRSNEGAAREFLTIAEWKFVSRVGGWDYLVSRNREELDLIVKEWKERIAKRKSLELTEQVFNGGLDDDSVDIDQVLALNGVHLKMEPSNKEINWDLLSRMASKDFELLAFLKHRRGFTTDEIAVSFGCSRSAAGDRIRKFIKRLNDIRWDLQIIQALGINEAYGLSSSDQSEFTPEGSPDIGWEEDEIDLDSSDHISLIGFKKDSESKPIEPTGEDLDRINQMSFI